MKIIHLIPKIEFGGTERIMLTMANFQKSQGHEVIVISFSQNKAYTSLSSELTLIQLPEPSIRWSWNSTHSSNLEPLKNKLSELAPDIIHSHSFWTDLLLYSFEKIETAKYYSHYHLYYPFFEKKTFWNVKNLGHIYLQKRLLKKYKEFGTRFIAVSSSIASYYSKVFTSHLKKRISVIYNSIDLSLYSAQEKDHINLNLVSIGRLAQDKNYFFLLEVALYLKKQDVDFEWKIAGEGVLRETLEKQIIDSELHSHVFLIGQVSDVASILSQSSFLIHGAKSESFGLVFIESMACGVPSISLKANGNEELVQHHVSGILLDTTTTAKDFAETIISTFQNDALRKEMSRNGLEFVKQFDSNEINTQILNLYLNSK